MNELIKVLPNFKKFNSYINDIKNGTNPIMLSGLTDSAKVHFAYATHFYIEKPICIITYNEMQARKIIKDLNYFSKEVEYFPKREILSFDYLAESQDISYKRISCLNNIYEKKAKVIVTTIEAVMQKIISKDALYKNILNLKINEIIKLEEIKEKLVYLGYERREIVENKSEFSIRGGIVDIAITDKKGVRIELWGDEIDSIRHFEISTQRSTDKLDKIKIFPATEFVLENDLETIIEDIQNKAHSKEDIDIIRSGEYLNKVDKYFNSFYKKQETIIDYLKDNYIIFLDEISKIKSRTENILKDNENLIKSLVEKKKIVTESLNNLDNYMNFSDSIKHKQTIYLSGQDIGFVDKQSMHAKRNGYSLSYREVNFFRSSMDLLFKEIQSAKQDKKTIIILGGSEQNCKKLNKLLRTK